MFKILIVDDNTSDREGIRDLVKWSDMGAEVVGLAVDGEDGFEKALQLCPDVILTDVSMPILNGLDMMEKLKLKLPHVRCIFMSGFSDFNYVRDAMKYNAYAYVLKPIKLKELEDAVRTSVYSCRQELEKDRIKKEMEQQISDSLPILREQFAMDLAYRQAGTQYEIVEKMHFLKMDYSERLFIVVFVLIDSDSHQTEDVTISEKYIIMHKLKIYMESTLLKENGFILTRQANALSAALFAHSNPLEGTEADTLTVFYENLLEFKEYINSCMLLKLTIGMSGLSADVSEIPTLLERAENAAKFKFYSEGNKIIPADEVHVLEEPISYDLFVIKNEIGEVLEQDIDEKVSLFVEKYLATGKKYSEAYIKSFAFAIIHVLQFVLSEKNESFKNMIDSDVSVWVKLAKFETIVDLKQWLINIMNTVRTYLKSKDKDSGRYYKIVEDIKQIIDEKYGEIQSIEQIIKPIYISPSHANFIFKQQTGKTIFDYLLNKRMEIAKKLLSNPYVKIYEVAEKTGYKNNSYFVSVFKENHGVTPKQYMERLQK